LSNAEQRDSWLNSSHWTLATDTKPTYQEESPIQLDQQLCHDLAKWLSDYLYFFSFLFFSYWTYNYKMEHGKVSHDFVTMSQWCDGWSQMVMSQVTVTEYHMTRVT